MKRFFAFLVMFLFVVCLVGCGEEKNVIKIGSSGPLSGEASIYGQAVKKGLELAVEEINQAGGVNVNGEMMDFEIIDFVNDDRYCYSDAFGGSRRSLFRIKGFG